MSDAESMVPAAEARQALDALSRRIGMLHLAYARLLVEELGEERGRELVRKAVWAYGTQVGEETRRRVLEKGLEPLPENFKHGSDLSPLGFDHRAVVVDGEARKQGFGCQIAAVWLEAGEPELGALYCLVDPAKMQAYSPGWTLVHTQNVSWGDECCEQAVRPLDGGVGETGAA